MMRKLDAYRVYLIYAALSSFFFWAWAALSALYRIQAVGMGPLELVLAGTALEISAFVFEIPTGVVADTISRRRSIIIGTVLIGSGFALEGSVATVGIVIAAQVIWGLGWTFTSGATQAWLADELGDDTATTRALLRGSQVRQAASVGGIGLAMALASINLALPLLAGGIGMLIVAVFLLIAMPETGFRPTPTIERETWTAMRDVFFDGVRVVRRRPIILSLFGVTFLVGAFSETFDRLWEALLLDRFEFPPFPDWTPVIWFGLIDAVAVLLSIAVTGYIRRRLDADGALNHIPAVLAILTATLAASVVGLGLAGHFWVAVGLYQLALLLRIVHGPLLTGLMNKHLESGSRATVFSMQSQADAGGQILGGPALGALAAAVSLGAAFVVAGMLLLPAVGLYAWASRDEGIPSPTPPR